MLVGRGQARKSRCGRWRGYSRVGRYSCAHADGGTHAGVCLLSRTVDPVRIPRVAAEHPPGRQQRHHQHLRVTQASSRHSATQFSVISTWALDSSRGLHIGSSAGLCGARRRAEKRIAGTRSLCAASSSATCCWSATAERPIRADREAGGLRCCSC